MSRPKPTQPGREKPSPALRTGAIYKRFLVPSLVTGVFLAAIFLVPYYVPIRFPSGSQAWEFGFNNTTAQELIALMLLALFLWRLFFGRSDIRHTAVARAVIGEESPESLRSLWIAMGAIQLVSSACLIAWYNILPYTHYGEFTYFMQRLEIMVGGGVPHRDFDFDYGPGMLAIPLFVYKLFQAHLSIEASYFAVLLLHFAMGYALLAYLVSRVKIQRGRTILFLLFAVPFINFTMGLQYTPLRFTIALASIFAIRHIHLAASHAPLRRWILLAAAALLLPLFNFLISPEMGLALTVALGVYFGWFIFGSERRFAVLVLPVLASVALAYFVLPRAFFNSMLSFGKGGASFPIFPTVHILAFLASAIWVFPQLGVIAIRDKTAAAAFCAGLAILMGLFILPATGRCDAGHIFINSIGLLIITLAAASWLASKWTWTIWSAFGVVFVILIMAAFWDNYKEPMGEALQVRSELLQRADYAPDNYLLRPPGSPLPSIHYSKLLPIAPWLAELPDVKIGLPMGADESVERYLRLTGRLAPEYHIAPYFDIFGAEELQEKYNDMRTMEYILIPESYLSYLQPFNPEVRMRLQGEADCRYLSGLLLFPVDLAAIHPMFVPNSEIIHHVAQEYVLASVYPDQQHPEMLLLKRKAP
jgi:hypothetical protein